MRLYLAVILLMGILAVPAFASEDNGDDGEVVFIGESSDGETVVVYEDPDGEAVVIRRIVENDVCDCCPTEEPFQVNFSGFGHADYRYPEGGPDEAFVDRIQLQWSAGKGPWRGLYKVDYREGSGKLEFGELSLTYTDPEGKWRAMAGRGIFVYANTPPPDRNRFNGYSDNVASCLTAPGVMVSTKIGDVSWGAGWLASNDKVGGPYDGFALTASGTASNGIYASALGYWARDIELWGIDTTIPLDGRGSYLQFSAAGDEGAAKAHGYWLGTTLALDDEERWWLNAGYDRGWEGGVEYKTIPVSINYDWPQQEGQVTSRITLEYRVNQITNEGNWSLRFQFPLLTSLEL